jgi:hypothetical protein
LASTVYFFANLLLSINLKMDNEMLQYIARAKHQNNININYSALGKRENMIVEHNHYSQLDNIDDISNTIPVRQSMSRKKEMYIKQSGME